MEKGLALTVLVRDDLPLVHGGVQERPQCLMILAGNPHARERRVEIVVERRGESLRSTFFLTIPLRADGGTAT